MDSIIGLTVKELRPMTRDELANEGWSTRQGSTPTVIVLSDGTKIYPSRDSEGNGPGVLFGFAKGKSFMFG